MPIGRKPEVHETERPKVDMYWNPFRGLSTDVAAALGVGDAGFQAATRAMVLEAIFSGTFDGGHVTSISSDLVGRGWGEDESVILTDWIVEMRKEFLRNYGLESDPNVE